MREALRADSSTSQYADSIAIETCAGQVILRGLVDDLIDNDNLLAVASDVAGVTEVVDALRVRGLEARVTGSRRLQDYAHRQRRTVKVHAVVPHGHVVRLFPEEGYGFLETADEAAISFYRNSVVHDVFDRLAIGTAVSFVGEEGDNGRQASTVRVVGRPHIAPAMR